MLIIEGLFNFICNVNTKMFLTNKKKNENSKNNFKE